MRSLILLILMVTLTACGSASASDHTYQSIQVAHAGDKYKFEYYFMKSDKSAEAVYEYAVENLKKLYASDYYCEVVLKENTVLLTTSYLDHKEEAKEIIRSIGY